MAFAAALEQAARGVAVRHVVATGPYRSALKPLVDELGPLHEILVVGRERQGVAQRPAAGDDGHLVHRVDTLEVLGSMQLQHFQKTAVAVSLMENQGKFQFAGNLKLFLEPFLLVFPW